MSLQQLFILAVAAMIGLAILRVTRVHAGRTPLPEGGGRRAFQLAFVVVPPIALGALIQPAADAASLRWIAWVPLYGIILAGLALLMLLAAVVVELVAPARSRRLLLLALVGSEGDPEDLAFDPPVTTTLAASMALVETTNAVFPRGPEFRDQVQRASFRADWDALDAATRTLEGRIADDRRLGLGVAAAAQATATDARGRLETLRGIVLARDLAAAV